MNLQRLHSENRHNSEGFRAVAPEVGRRSSGRASPAARADVTAAPIWPHGIGCSQRRDDCESGLSAGGLPTEGPRKYVGLPEVRARVPERRYRRQRVRRPDVGHQQREAAGDATDRRG